MSQVIVFAYKEPHQRFLSWFLRHAAIANNRVTSPEELRALLETRTSPVVVVNTTAPLTEIAVLVQTMRQQNEKARIILLQDGAHSETDPVVEADVCIHDAHDADDLVAAIRSVLDGESP